MKAIALYMAIILSLSACTKKSTFNPVHGENRGTASIHYSKSLNNDFSYYFVLRESDPSKSYRWIINGDEIAGNAEQVRHRFGQPGVYTVCAISGDEYACTTVHVNSPQ